jgi:nucleotide-binding universal stress UspA family protein
MAGDGDQVLPQWRPVPVETNLKGKQSRRIQMRGTLVCAMTDGEESSDAVALGAELSERLGLRLVLAHAADGIDGTGGESVSMKGNRQGAERLLAQLAIRHGVAARAERRIAVGEPAIRLGQIAAEEGADVIVVGARTRGWRGGLESRLADALEMETPVPVLIAPPRARRGRNEATLDGGRR